MRKFLNLFVPIIIDVNYFEEGRTYLEHENAITFLIIFFFV